MPTKGMPNGMWAKVRKFLFVQTYSDPKSAAWREWAVARIQARWKNAGYPAQPRDTPTLVTIAAVKSRPKRLMRKCDPERRLWCPMKPDNDNIEKAVFDALKDAGVLTDDTRVVYNKLAAMYTRKGEEPFVFVEVGPAPEFPPEEFQGDYAVE